MYRNSLRACFLMMAEQFRLLNYERLSIINNSAGKYYSLLTDKELEAKIGNNWNPTDNIVLRLTRGELRSLALTMQTNLFQDIAAHD